MFPYLFMASCVELYFEKTFKFRDIFNIKTMACLVILGITGDLMSLGYTWSAEYIIMSHSSIFNSLGGVFIVIGRLFLRRYVHKLEILGTGIALLGCVATLLDTNAEKVDVQKSNMPLGILISMMGSISGAIYFNVS